MVKKKILCVIQARGGSKGIPNKNIYEINNHPLISYSIEAAKKSKYIDDIIVSSDSKKICKVANSYGAKTPFLRPKFLAKDKTASVTSLIHAVKTYEKISNINYDYIIELPCVSPLRDHKDVDKAIKKIYGSNYDSVISYVDTGEKHPLRLKRIKKNKVTNFCKEYPEIEKLSFRQSFESSFIRNGAIYLVSKNSLLKLNSRIGKKSYPLIMSYEKSTNIDEKFDLLIAKYLIENGHCSNVPKKISFFKNLKKIKINKNKKQILVSTPLHFINSIKTQFNKLGICKYYSGASSNQIKKVIENIDIWVCSPSPEYKINDEILKYAKNLKFIITPSTGSNHISLSDCKKNNIKVLSLKNSKSVKNITASSEFTFSLMLGFIRKISKAKRIVKSGHWRDMEDHLRGDELQGKSVGIVGYGRIGSNIAAYCKPFKMKIYAYDPHLKIKSNAINQVSNIKILLNKSDIVFICVHLNDTTKMMVNDTWFKSMKANSILINTSRGEVINESSLIKALKLKRIKGAAVDVVSDEQNIYKTKNKLIEYSKENENLLVTPHIAGLTYESEYKAAMSSINFIKKLKNA